MVAFAAAWTLAVLVLPQPIPLVRRGLNAILMAAIASLVLMPWWIRNAAMFGEFIPLTTKGALNLYAGTQIRPYYLTDARNRGLSVDPVVEERERTVTMQARAAHSNRERDHIYLNAALDNIRREPWEQAKHLVRKVAFLWQPNIGPRHAGRVGFAWVLWLIAAAHWTLLLAGVTGLWVFRRPPRALFVLGIPFILVMTFHVVVGIGEPRYHLSLVPFLLWSSVPPVLRLLRLDKSTWRLDRS
jgi:hypothetical protein